MATDCKHSTKVRVRDTRTTSEYLCVQCLARFTKPRTETAPRAPRGWQAMEQGELAIWYVKNIWGAML